LNTIGRSYRYLSDYSASVLDGFFKSVDAWEAQQCLHDLEASPSSLASSYLTSKSELIYLILSNPALLRNDTLLSAILSHRFGAEPDPRPQCPPGLFLLLADSDARSRQWALDNRHCFSSLERLDGRSRDVVMALFRKVSFSTPSKPDDSSTSASLLSANLMVLALQAEANEASLMATTLTPPRLWDALPYVLESLSAQCVRNGLMGSKELDVTRLITASLANTTRQSIYSVIQWLSS
jgi:hypothetical protein